MAWETRTEWNLATNPKLTDPYGTVAVPGVANGTAPGIRALGGGDFQFAGGGGATVYTDGMRAITDLRTATSAWTAAYPTGTGGTDTGSGMSRMGLVVGKWCSIGVLYSQDKVLTGADPKGRSISGTRRIGGVSGAFIYGASAPNEPQTDTPLTASFFVEPGYQDYTFRLYTGADNQDARTYWRNLIICLGDTQAEVLEKVQTYFDGSSPGFTFNDQYVKPHWEGTPFRSKSFFTWKSWVPDPPPTIQWDDKTKMSFQAGLDRGVLYLQDGTTVPWNGLTSVNTYDEANSEVESYYVDGLKLLDVSGYGEFEADLSAFTTPKEFDRCVGLGEIKQGLSVSGQQRESFGLSYRTLVGDSQKGLRRGYKIHLIYGATALSESENHETLSDDPAAMSLSWKLKTVAQHIPGRAPSAHLIIDTRYMYSSSVGALEAVLYGADQPPRLPTPTEVLDIIEEGSGLRVIDNGDGTFSVESDVPNAIKVISSTEFEIDWVTMETTVDTYTVKSF